MSNKVFNKLSLAAAISGLSLALPVHVLAQNEVEQITITGSRISGTPKDGELPVDIYTQADLEQIGSPSPVQFAKSLSTQGNTSGENSYLTEQGHRHNSTFALWEALEH